MKSFFLFLFLAHSILASDWGGESAEGINVQEETTPEEVPNMNCECPNEALPSQNPDSEVMDSGE